MSPEHWQKILASGQLREQALGRANQLFHNAYQGHGFERITIEDVEALLADEQFMDVLHCFGSGAQPIVRALQTWNKQRRNEASQLGQSMRGMDADDIANAREQLAELHTRPTPEPISQEDEFPF